MKTLIAVLAFSLGSLVPLSIASAIPNIGARADQSQEIKNDTQARRLCWFIGGRLSCF